MPMARSAVLAGRTAADLVRNVLIVVLMIAVGYAVGFRFTGGPAGALASIVVVAALLREISRSSRASFASSSVIFASLSSSSARRLSFAARSDATCVRSTAASSGTPDVPDTP
jgi:hypothetical protein